VNSCFTLALVTGQSVTDLSQNVFANLGRVLVRHRRSCEAGRMDPIVDDHSVAA